MAHMHKQTRDAFATRLTGLTTTTTKVFAQHVYSLPENVDLPALAIFALEEVIEVDAMGADPTQARMLEVAIEGIAQSTDTGPDDTLSQIALEVEQAVASDVTFGGLLITSQLEKIEYFYTGEGSKPGGSIRLTYVAEYRTSTSDPETSI